MLPIAIGSLFQLLEALLVPRLNGSRSKSLGGSTPASSLRNCYDLLASQNGTSIALGLFEPGGAFRRRLAPLPIRISLRIGIKAPASPGWGQGAAWGHQVLTSEYHLKQAGVAARMALAEPDPTKAAAFHVLALEHFAKAKLTEWAPDQSDELRKTRPRTGTPEEED